MCDTTAGPHEPAASLPRPAPGAAVDPIALEPVDEVEIVTLVDNVFDGLLTGDERTRRPSMGMGMVAAPQFEGGRTPAGMRAEHGFSALVRVRRADRVTTLLFDTGLSPDAMVVNADRLGIALDDIHGVVLSHGHFDHAGGLAVWPAGAASARCRWSCIRECGPGAGSRCPGAPPRNCRP